MRVSLLCTQNTPLCEQGIAGFSIGLAAMGHRAIAEIQFADYLFPAFDQIVNEAAKLRYRSGSQTNAGGLTIRTPCQAVGHGGLYHSQSIEQFLLPVPGLNVVMPRGPITAKGLLLAAIRSPDPTIVLEPKTLYRSSVEEVPTGDYSIPIGQAEVLRKGSDITLISWGAPLYTCLEAMDILRTPPEKLQHLVPPSLRKASVELIDLQTISPWDRRTVVESVKKTGRCVIVSEAPVTGSVSSEVASVIQKEAFLRLEVSTGRQADSRTNGLRRTEALRMSTPSQAPVLCLGGWDTPFVSACGVCQLL